MRCSDAHEVLNALIDDEDAGERQQAAAAHIASCSLCTARADDYRRMGEHLRAVAYAPTPPDLGHKIRLRLAAEAQPTKEKWRLDWRRLMQQAAVLVIVSGLSALLSWHLTETAYEKRRLERDVVAAHVRSLLQDSLVQVASSESHTVKPWFAGRVDFAPAVKDLTTQGFPLSGGRLDFIGNRRIATLVYKRRQHVINVFMWPADHRDGAAPNQSTLQGYNTITWTAGGMAYWAVSDLNAKELAQLRGLLGS
jgi:anti-sigma factor RsiW